MLEYALRGKTERARLLLRAGGRARRDHTGLRYVGSSGAVIIGIAAGLVPVFCMHKTQILLGL